MNNKKNFKSRDSVTSPKNSSGSVNKFKPNNNGFKYKKNNEKEKVKTKSFKAEDFFMTSKQLQQEIADKKSSPASWLTPLYDLREIIQDNNGSKGDHIKELTVLNDCFRSMISILTYTNNVYQDDEDYKAVKNLLESVYDLLVLLYDAKDEVIKKKGAKIIPTSLFNSLFTNISQCMHTMCPAVAQRNCRQFQSIIKNIKAPSGPPSPLPPSGSPLVDVNICYDNTCPITTSFFSTYQQKTCRRESDMLILLFKLINYLILIDPVNILSYWDIFLVDSYGTEGFLSKSFQQIPLVQRPIQFCKSESLKKSSLQDETSCLPHLPSFVFSSSAAFQFPLNLTENNLVYSRLSHMSSLKLEPISTQKYSSMISSLVFSHSNTRLRKEALQTLINFINIPSLSHWVLHFYQQKKHELQHKANSSNFLSSKASKSKLNSSVTNNNSLSSKINKILKKAIYTNTILLVLESKLEIFQTILSFFSTIFNSLPMILINEKTESESSCFSYTNKEIEKIIRLLYTISFEVAPVNSAIETTATTQSHSKFNLPPYFITVIGERDKKKTKFQFSERAVACIHWFHLIMKNIPTVSNQNEDSILSVFQKVLIDSDHSSQPELFSCFLNSCLNSSPFGEFLKESDKQEENSIFKNLKSEKFSCLLFNIVYMYSYSSKHQNNSNTDPLIHLTFNSIRLVLPMLLSSNTENSNTKINYLIKFFINFLIFLKNSSSDIDKELYIKLLGLLYASKEFWILIGIHDEILKNTNNQKIKNYSKKTLSDLKMNIIFNYISSSSNILSLLNMIYGSKTTPSSSLIRLRVLETISKIDPYFWLLWTNVQIIAGGNNELVEINKNDSKINSLKSDNRVISLCHAVLLFLIKCTSDTVGTIRATAYRVLGKQLSSWSSFEETEKVDILDDFYSQNSISTDTKLVNNINLDISSLYKSKKFNKLFFTDEYTTENFLLKYISSSSHSIQNKNFLNFPVSLRLWIELFFLGTQDSKLSVRIQSSWCLNLITVMHQLQYRFDSSSSLKKKLYHHGILCYNQSYGSSIFDDFDDIINFNNDNENDEIDSNNEEENIIKTIHESQIFSTPSKKILKEEIDLTYQFNFRDYIDFFRISKDKYTSCDLVIPSFDQDNFLDSYNSAFLLFSKIIELNLKCLNDSEKIIPTSLRGLGYSLICYGPLLIKNLLRFYSSSSEKSCKKKVDEQIQAILQINLNVFNALKAKYNINIDDNLYDLDEEVNESFIMSTIVKLFIKKYTIKVLCSLLQTFLYIYISSFLIQLDRDLFQQEDNYVEENNSFISAFKTLTYMKYSYSLDEEKVESMTYPLLNCSNNSRPLTLHNNSLPLLFLISSFSHGPVQLQLLAGRSLLYLILGLPQLQIISTIESQSSNKFSIIYPISIDYIFKIIEASLLLLDDLSQTNLNLSSDLSIRSAQAVNTERFLNLRFVSLILLLSCLRIANPFAKYMSDESNSFNDNQRMILRQLHQSILSHGPGLLKLLDDNFGNSHNSTLKTILSPPPGLRYHKPNLPYLEDIQDKPISYELITPLISMEIIKFFDEKVPAPLSAVYKYAFVSSEAEESPVISVSPLVNKYISRLDYFSQPTSIGEEDDEF